MEDLADVRHGRRIRNERHPHPRRAPPAAPLRLLPRHQSVPVPPPRQTPARNEPRPPRPRKSFRAEYALGRIYTMRGEATIGGAKADMMARFIGRPKEVSMGRDLVRRIRTHVSAKLGRCALCMRWSFRGALCGWGVVILFRQLAPEWWQILLLWPLSFTGLWLLHIGIFGGRALWASAETRAREDGAGGLTRRDMFRFTQAMAAAVLVSVILPKLTWGQSCESGYHLCSDRAHCCPNGMTYACPYNECTGRASYCTRPTSDEDYFELQKCCPGLFRC